MVFIKTATSRLLGFYLVIAWAWRLFRSYIVLIPSEGVFIDFGGQGVIDFGVNWLRGLQLRAACIQGRF